MKIYGYSTFNPLKVVATTEEAGIDCEYIVIDLPARANRRPEHMARHPFGKVPVLETDSGEYLFESAAICRYLARMAADGGASLYGREPLEAARIDQLMDAMSHHVGRWLSVFFWEEVVKPTYMKQEPDPKVLADAQGALDKQLPWLNGLLRDGEFLCGPRLTIADTFAYAYGTITEITSASFAAYGNLQRWYNGMGERPAIRRARAVVFGEAR